MKTAEQVQARYVPGLTFDKYRTLGRGKDDQGILVVNASLLKESTPKEMRARLVGEDVDQVKMTEPLVLGNTVHHAVLEPECLLPENFDRHYVYSPTEGLGTKKADSYRRKYSSRILTSAKIVEKAKRMRDAIMSLDKAKALLADSPHRELTGIVGDKEFKIVRKIRIDATGGIGDPSQAWSPWLLDIKTVRADRFTKGSFASECRRMGYGIQFSYYKDTDEMIIREICGSHPKGCKCPPCARIAGGRPLRDRFGVIAVQNAYPFLARLFWVEQESLNIGSEMYKERLSMLVNANETQTWEAYEHEMETPELRIYTRPQ